MREDYNYVRKAVDIVLATTDGGNTFIEKVSDAELEKENPSDLLNLLAMCQDSYIILPDGVVNFEGMKEAFDKAVRESYDPPYRGMPIETIKAAWNESLIGIKLIIWG